MFLARRPGAGDIQRFLDASRELPLSYDTAGLAATSAPGFTVDEQVMPVGRGDADFARAVEALTGWRHFDLGWVELHPKGAPIAPGTVVAVLIHHLGFWSLNGCRVLYEVGERGGAQFGFAYGTLTNHAECGEEIFEVRRAGSGDITYGIRAVSRPRSMLARLGYPVTRRLQARFRRDSARAVRQAIVTR